MCLPIELKCSVLYSDCAGYFYACTNFEVEVLESSVLLLGSPEDKLKLFFDMYDVDGDNKLDRDEFKQMMR